MTCFMSQLLKTQLGNHFVKIYSLIVTSATNSLCLTKPHAFNFHVRHSLFFHLKLCLETFDYSKSVLYNTTRSPFRRVHVLCELPLPVLHYNLTCITSKSHCHINQTYIIIIINIIKQNCAEKATQ